MLQRRIQGGQLRKLKVHLADFCYHNRHTLATRYAPLNVGFIAQYVDQQFDKSVSISIDKEVETFLQKVEHDPPDVVGLSLYYWNTELNRYVVNYLRNRLGDKVTIVLGGPSIDSDESEQTNLINGKFLNVNAIVENEGELGFYHVVEHIMSTGSNKFSGPMDGVSFFSEGQLIKGRPVGTTLDISQLRSPYLSGFMEDFLDTEYQPLVQTSRLCPYTCAFCVSGKTRGKLRGFDIDQVKDEISYVAKKYSDRPYQTFFLADENFGILKRDIAIAEHIAYCRDRYGFPKQVFFYNDKNFSGTSQSIVKILGSMNKHGLTLALQTENPAALKAINRRNVNETKIVNAIEWAKKENIATTTELIFGLPYETKESFTSLLDRSVRRGFDTILCHNLFIMDGIELNRENQRKEFGIETKYRVLGSNYGAIDGKFIMEHEEVVVKSASFTFDEYSFIRNVNFLFYAIFSQDFQKWFFKYLIQQNVSLTDFVLQFFSPPKEKDWPTAYFNFLRDFKSAVLNELFETREELYASTQDAYGNNGNEVGEPSRINVYFGARLIYTEKDWIAEVLAKHVDYLNSKGKYSIDRGHTDFLITLGERERVNLRGEIDNRLLCCEYDILGWMKDDCQTDLGEKITDPRDILLSVSDDQKMVIRGFRDKFHDLPDDEYYFSAVDFVNPSHLLRYEFDFQQTSSHSN